MVICSKDYRVGNKKKTRGFEDQWNMIDIASNVSSKILNTGMLGHPIENYVKGSDRFLM